MLQIQPNARATPATRAEIARSSKPNGVLAVAQGQDPGRPITFGSSELCCQAGSSGR